MKRRRTPHPRTKPKESAFLVEAKRRVTTCAVEGTPQAGVYVVPTPHGTVRLTMRAEMLVYTPTQQLVRPS